MCRFRLFVLFPLLCKKYKSKMSVTLAHVQTEEPVELVEPVEEAVVEEAVVEEPIPEVEEVVPEAQEAVAEAVPPKKTWTTQGSTKRKSGEGSDKTSSANKGSQNETTFRE